MLMFKIETASTVLKIHVLCKPWMSLHKSSGLMFPPAAMPCLNCKNRKAVVTLSVSCIEHESSIAEVFTGEKD